MMPHELYLMVLDQSSTTYQWSIEDSLSLFHKIECKYIIDNLISFLAKQWATSIQLSYQTCKKVRGEQNFGCLVTY